MKSATVIMVAASLALVSLVSRTGRADPGGAAVFAIQVAATRDEARALVPVLRELISAQDVHVEFATVERIDPSTVVRGPGIDRANAPLGRAFVDLSDPARATIYVVDGTWERVLVRHVPRASNPDVVRETVAQIVSTAVEALRGGSFARYSEPVSTLEPKADAPAGSSAPLLVAADRGAASSPRAEGVNLETRFGAMYEVDLYAADRTFVHGPALQASVALAMGRVRPALWMTGQYRWPVIVDEAPVGFRIDTTALRLLVGAEFDVGAKVSCELAVGGGIDVVHLDPRRASVGDQVWLASERGFVVGLARVMMGVRWRATTVVNLDVLIASDIDPSRTRLLFDQGASREPLLAPYAVRPALAVALSVP